RRCKNSAQFMPRSTTISIRSAISSPARFTNKGAPPRWPSGAPSRPNRRLGLRVLRPTQTTCRCSDKALQRAVPTVSHPMSRYALSQAEFPREFAEFIDFVGAGPLDKQTRTVERRLRELSPAVRAIYGDRYFFQQECLRFTYEV